MIFLGPEGLTKALPMRGQASEVYPMDDGYHLEGFLKKHWESHKIEESDLKTFEDVSSFVSKSL